MATIRPFILAILLAALTAILLAAESSKGSVNLSITSPISLNGTELKVGEYTLQWVTQSPEANVKLLRNGRVKVEARGKFVERGDVATHTMVMVTTDSSGKKTVSEIRFKGKTTALVFGE